MAEAKDSSITETNAAPVPVPALETKHNTSEAGEVLSGTDNTTANSSQEFAKLGDGSTNINAETRSNFREGHINSCEERDNTGVHGNQMPLNEQHDMASRPIATATDEELASADSDVNSLYVEVPAPVEPVQTEPLPSSFHRGQSWDRPRPYYRIPRQREPLRLEPNRMSFLDERQRKAHVLDIQIRDPTEGEATGLERAERVRINSAPLLKILDKLTTESFSNSYTFLRPFRFLMQQRDRLGRYLEELEKIHDNKDTDGTDDEHKPPTMMHEPGRGRKRISPQLYLLKTNGLLSLEQ